MTRSFFATYIAVFISILAFVIALHAATEATHVQASASMVPLPPPSAHPELGRFTIYNAFTGTEIKADQFDGLVAALTQHDISAACEIDGSIEDVAIRANALFSFLVAQRVPHEAISITSRLLPTSNAVRVVITREAT